MDTSLQSKQKIEWDRIPLDVLVEIGKLLIENGGNIAAMRATCAHWKDGMASVETRLAPLGLPFYYSAYQNIISINMATRNHGHAATNTELAALCTAAPKLAYLNLSGAYQISSLGPLANSMQALMHLVLDRSSVTDESLSAALPNLQALLTLSLRECVFLRGEFLSSLKDLKNGPQLRRLDLADCALAMHLNPSIARDLATFTCLEVLDIGGNNACDMTAGDIANLPRLKAFGLRDAHALTEGGLEELAAGPAGKTIEILDLEGCSGIGEGSWAALSRLQALQDLSLARLPQLLQAANIADYAAAALWRWPHLRRLCLAGSNIHPTKLKLLAATCGAGLAELDISAPKTAAFSSPSRPHFSRLAPHQVRDLVSSAKSLKHLRSFKAAWTGMPLEAAVAFLRAAPRLKVLDLSGCCLGPRGGLMERPTVAGRLWSSGIFMPGSGSYRAETADVSTSIAAPGPEEFALALGGMTGLRTLRLEDCGLKSEHLKYLGWSRALEKVSFAGNRGVGDKAVKGLAGFSANLTEVNISGTSITDAAFAGISSQENALSKLHTLKLARCSLGLSAEGFQKSMLEGQKLRNLKVLDLSDCPWLDGDCIQMLSESTTGLVELNLSGCGSIGSVGVGALAKLKSLQKLSLSRCGDAVTDESITNLCDTVQKLTSLKLDGARGLTSISLSTLGSLSLLSELDLTCCVGLGDDETTERLLPEGLKASVQLPTGGKAVKGSPFKSLNSASLTLGGPLAEETI